MVVVVAVVVAVIVVAVYDLLKLNLTDLTQEKFEAEFLSVAFFPLLQAVV